MEASPVGSMDGQPVAVGLESPDLWVVMPTYNEALNIEPIVDATHEHLPPGGKILVVDDNSPDGTGQLADRLADELDFVEVLHRSEKSGLGDAYVAGFRRALEAGASHVAQMDADFSHDPGDIPRLLAATAEADFVIGSRYVDGGGAPDWGAVRHAISAAASVYSRLALNLPYRDLTSGFKVIRRAVLERIDLDEIASHGYAFQIELTFRAARAGFRIEELPIQFHDRRAGKSKMDMRILLEAAVGVPRMRLRR